MAGERAGGQREFSLYAWVLLLDWNRVNALLTPQNKCNKK